MPANTKQLKNFARNLRKSQTEAEKLLWSHLRNRQMASCKFRRQFPIERYIVDFVCLSRKLIIEIDGGQHAETVDIDTARTKFLNMKGFKILRFWNHEVLKEPESVLHRIFDELEYTEK